MPYAYQLPPNKLQELRGSRTFGILLTLVAAVFSAACAYAFTVCFVGFSFDRSWWSLPLALFFGVGMMLSACVALKGLLAVLDYNAAIRRSKVHFRII